MPAGMQKLAAARATVPPSPPPPPRRTAFDIEEVLGTNWLAKLGIILLVFGEAFFLAQEWERISALGKILIGFAGSGVLIGGGVLLERHERYRNLGRAGIGGGWATAFFTTYAMYHVEGARVQSLLEWVAQQEVRNVQKMRLVRVLNPKALQGA